MPTIFRIANTPRDYAWGVPGGISSLFGWPVTDRREAELWLGSHPVCPATFTDAAPWPDLAAREAAGEQPLPYLLKVLAADTPLSLQAHPTPAQAAEGFARENADGVPLDAPWRNYRDPFAKPELIVAVNDGFQALCGFRPIAESLAFVNDLIAHAEADTELRRWRDLLAAPQGLRKSVAWLLSGSRDVGTLVTELERQAAARPADLELVVRLAAIYPGDPGIAVAQLLNRVTLDAGEGLWLPAGNIHAYLTGIGVELMGPSDNVLRGGLTPKHVDVDELISVLDFSDGPAPLLVGEPAGAHALAYVPPADQADFRLEIATGDCTVTGEVPSIVVVLDGFFTVVVDDESVSLQPGQAALVDGAAELLLQGSGRAAIATGTPR